MENCAKCALKHIAQAMARALEMLKGYPDHYWVGLGYLAEAEDALVPEWMPLVDGIRQARKAWEDDPLDLPDFLGLIHQVSEATHLDVSQYLDQQLKKEAQDDASP